MRCLYRNNKILKYRSLRANIIHRLLLFIFHRKLYIISSNDRSYSFNSLVRSRVKKTPFMGISKRQMRHSDMTSGRMTDNTH